MAGVNTVELSKKSMEFVQKRRGELTVDQYINMVLENIYDQTAQSQPAFGGASLLDLIEMRAREGGISQMQQTSTKSESKVSAIFAELKNAHPQQQQRISEREFRQKCADYNLSPAELEHAISIYRQYEASPENSTNKDTHRKTEDIIDRLKERYGSSIPYNLYVEACIQAGIGRPEIDFGLKEYQLLFNTNDDNGAPLNLDAIYIYECLKNSTGNNVQREVYRAKCRESGIRDPEIDAAEKYSMNKTPSSEGKGNDGKSSINKVTLVLYELKNQYENNVPLDALYAKCKERGLSNDEIHTIEQIYAKRAVFAYNEMVTDGTVKGSDFKESMLDIKIIRLLDGLKLTYGNMIPATAYMDKCIEMGFSEQELAYARKKYDDYIDTLITYEDVKYINTKAYIVLSHLKKSYSGKVPYNIFYSRCRALGISKDNIEAAYRQAGGTISRETGADNMSSKMLDDVAAEYVKEHR
ncbi:MAG TPA: hypothetical protein VK436_06090 [Methanocella sp.]|nr:hypothetical protein [Methanocella sp.]